MSLYPYIYHTLLYTGFMDIYIYIMSLLPKFFMNSWNTRGLYLNPRNGQGSGLLGIYIYIERLYHIVVVILKQTICILK